MKHNFPLIAQLVVIFVGGSNGCTTPETYESLTYPMYIMYFVKPVFARVCNMCYKKSDSMLCECYGIRLFVNYIFT
jgi:hypothetical protein